MYVLGLRVVWRIRRRPEGGRDEGPQARHYASTQSPQAGRGGPRVLLGNAQQRASRNGDRGLVMGYLALSRGSITLAPVLLVAGYCVLIPASLLIRGRTSGS